MFRMLGSHAPSSQLTFLTSVQSHQTPSSLAPPITPGVPNPLKVHSVYWRRLWGLPSKPTMVNQDEEGIPYTDHSGDEQHRNLQQADLDLNATANGSTRSVDRNAEAGGTQNGQPGSSGDNSGGRRSTSAFDRLGPKPFGEIGSDKSQIIQELRHRMQAMELQVKGDLRSRRRLPPRRRSRSKSKTSPRRRERTPDRRRRHPSSSDDRESSSDDSREPR
ncbi:hypothetical protein PIB30_007738 [Stylosanthes scabra]|uniref:Uncharacterized protein n=1 Tax=Stylosanthes scabra TaxID=79078 RepID=A0ABU6Y185_9FABA|nr:hypothetical protein [Stylosanthes scabra]